MDILIADAPSGSKFSVVAQVLENTEKGIKCAGISPEQIFWVSGAPPLKPASYTFYDLVKSTVAGQDCCFDETTVAHVHLLKDPFSTVTIMDFCSGMGGFSIGSQILGMKTLAFVEQSQLACEALKANFNSPVIQGDLGNVDTLKQIHPLKGKGHVQVTGGFPCQGFSRQGDMQGMEDHRSHSLYYILQGAWFLQADDILLECVANVINFPQAQSCISQYAQTTGMHMTKLTFDLLDQWPVRRNRFWCHLIRHDLPQVDIPRWPTSPHFRTLGDIMPLDALWPIEVEDQLAWDAGELAIYFDQSFGADQRLLTAEGQAPTVLHSWGHMNRPCPCGCRQAFSLWRLRTGGARGFGLLSARDGRPRHLHSEEGALLCTVPLSYGFPMAPRAALSLLGQIAAPLQVVWVQAHILAALQKHHWGWTNVDPLIAIQVLQYGLRAWAFARWITPAHYTSRTIQMQIDGEAHILEFQINTPITVRDLAKAEKNLAGWGQYAIVTFHGHRLCPDDLLLPGHLYTIKLCQSGQARPFPLQDNILAGGDEVRPHQLGDRIIWGFMKAMTESAANGTSHSQPFLMYPFRALQFLSTDLPQKVMESWRLRKQQEQGDIHLICELHGHWIYLHGLWNSRSCGFAWTLYDGLRPGHALPWMSQVVTKFCKILGTGHLGLSYGHSVPQSQAFTCGTIALVNMAMQLGLLQDITELEIADLHRWLICQQTFPGHITAGGLDDWHHQLASLLQDKGVSASDSAERAQMIATKLGLKHVQAILRAKAPWAELKAAASKPGTMFRLISHDEQKAYIAERAKTKHGAKIQNHKSKKSQKGPSALAPLQLDPDQFELNAHHFKDDQDLPVPQIHFDEVSTEARGVALCTVAMACRFLETPCSISTDALALLFLDSPDPAQCPNANLKKIIIPAKFKGTDEHTLIYGFILQLGDLTVCRESASADSNPDVIDTMVIKMQVYKDQLAMNWTRFSEAPIRALVTLIEPLQFCKGSRCGSNCNKFHPGLDETIDNVIFEIWARSFLDDHGRKTSQDKAILFTAFARIPDGALNKLLTSTPQGVYIEPRASRPGEHDDRYKVVWLPGSTADEAAHQCRTYEKAICMVRMKNKYGIRVKKDDEQSAWSHLRPGTDFIPITIQLIYELFPIPHGTQRHAIVKLLNDWGWTARPLQPGRGNFSHMAWRVGASLPPPQEVMTGFQNDVVITQVKELKHQEPQQHLIASSKTHRHLRSAPQSSSTTKPAADPWFESGKDPWGNYGPRATSHASGDGKQRLVAIQEQLKNDIGNDMAKKLEVQAQEAVKAAAASSNAAAGQQEQRLKALEIGFQEIKGQNNQFTAWFHQANEKLQATEATVGAMQQTLNTHQHEIHALGSTFQSTMKTVKDDLSHEMSESFNKQMSRLEALLEKKQRQA